MPNRKRNSWWAVSVVSTLFLLIAMGPARAADPPAEREFKKFFDHYVDDRSLLEKALNVIGLTSQDVGRSFALIAGVPEYDNLSDLRPAEVDIVKLTAYLKEQEFFEEIVVLKNADFNDRNLKYFLQSYFPERVKLPKSRFLFAFSGHGMNIGGDGYLLQSDATDFEDTFHSIDLRILRTMLKNVVRNAHHVLALINSCYGGNFVQPSFGRTPLKPTRPGAWALTAGAPNELVYSDPDVGPGSLFFETILAGLDQRADTFPPRDPDHPESEAGDGVVTFRELATWVQLAIRDHTGEKVNPLQGDLNPITKPSIGGFFFFDRRRQLEADVVPEWDPSKLIFFGRKKAMEQDIAVFQPEPPSFTRDYYKGQAAFQAQNYELALRHFRRLAEKGLARAQASLGVMYLEGRGVAQDDGEAVRWFRKAAEQGNAKGQSNLGVMYDSGRGVAQDDGEAVRWYREAAEQGHANAQYNLGVTYATGDGVAQDDRVAVRWLRKAAEQGNAYGQGYLGVMYQWGRGVAQDDREAVRWYQKAAEQAEETAQFNLGVMYELGRGVAQDDGEAVRWYRKAAEQGEANAMESLKRLGVN